MKPRTTAVIVFRALAILGLFEPAQLLLNIVFSSVMLLVESNHDTYWKSVAMQLSYCIPRIAAAGLLWLYADRLAARIVSGDAGAAQEAQPERLLLDFQSIALAVVGVLVLGMAASRISSLVNNLIAMADNTDAEFRQLMLAGAIAHAVSFVVLCGMSLGLLFGARRLARAMMRLLPRSHLSAEAVAKADAPTLPRAPTLP